MPRDPARALARDLARETRAEVRFDATSRALYSTDASNYRAIPIGVVIPRDREDVVRAVAVCRRHDAPIVSRGAGTSLAGQACNVAVVLDFSKHVDRILAIDPEARTATVEPGVVHDALRRRTEEQHRLVFGPDPATHRWCTFGGMIGNDSCGVHAQMAGRTTDNVEELRVLTYDGLELQLGALDERALAAEVGAGGRRGELLGALRSIRDEHAALVRERFPRIPRRVSGYGLDQLLPENGFHVARSLVGSEGTCVVLLEAKVRLVHSPAHRALVVLGFADELGGVDHLQEILAHQPIALEGFDHQLVERMREHHLHGEALQRLPDGRSWLLVELGADDPDEARERARELVRALGEQVAGLVLLDEQAQPLWAVRESALGATARTRRHRDDWPGWEDSAVPPAALPRYLRALRALLSQHGYEAALYGHFGQGCVHCRIDFDLATREGVARYRSFVEQAAELVVSFGGSLSGEHGDGKARGELLERMYGAELVEAMRRFRRAFDPEGRLNPGRVVDAEPLDSGLRLGPSYAPREEPTRLRFADDRGSFARATTRCVGVGKCRRREDAFMCPSYLATHDEKDTTRGRARVLFEMVRGDFVRDGWRSAEAAEALDLCLGCKGCKRDCPVGVDMARDKAEFLHHHWQGRLRPRSHLALGRIGTWLALARRVPRLAEFATHAPLLGRLAKLAAGVGASRELPHFAPRPFLAALADEAEAAPHAAAPNEPAREPGREVLLVPDAFDEALEPDVLHAAREAMRRLGYRVRVRRGRPLSVRPLLHFGMLERAARELRELARELSAEAREGAWILVLEPSSASVLRDELRELLGEDEALARLRSSCVTFSELLERSEPALPDLGGRRVLLQVHCHQKAVLDAQAPRRVLERMGAEVHEPEPGCCGMAGAFGLEAEHIEVSRAIAERALLPAVRAAGPQEWICAEGFSCRSQIGEVAARPPLHLAQLVLRALEQRAEPRASQARSPAREPAPAGGGA